MSIFSVLAVTPQTTINVSQSFEDGARLEIKFCGQFGPRKLEEFGERKKSFFKTNYFVPKQPKMSIFSVLAVTPQTTINVSQSFEDGARLEIKFCGQFGILATSGRFCILAISGWFWIPPTSGRPWVLATSGPFWILATSGRFWILATSGRFWILDFDH